MACASALPGLALAWTPVSSTCLMGCIGRGDSFRPKRAVAGNYCLVTGEEGQSADGSVLV